MGRKARDITEPVPERPSITSIHDRLKNLEKLVSNEIMHDLIRLKAENRIALGLLVAIILALLFG